MYSKGKASTVPSDSQAREKLALYVYEYLLHVGAQKAAQTFLSEIRWEKNITLGEPPGFLHSWWCVFWDLYCAAPERRDTCEHSSEAKAFHDYNPNVPSPGLAPMGPNDGMPGGPMPPGFFPHMMSPRYPGGPRGPVRLPYQQDNVSSPPGSIPQPMMPNNMDPRQGMNHMSRMSHPRAMGPGPGMNPGSYGMRPQQMGPGVMPPMSMAGPGPGPGGPRGWAPNTSSGYSSSSPGNYSGPQGGPPGTPVMPSPQGSTGPYSPASTRMPTPGPGNRRDSTNSGDNVYAMMNPVPGGNRPGFPMGAGPDGPMQMGGPGDIPVMNGDGMDGMKHSPANGPGTPRDDGMGDYGMGYQDGPPNHQNESEAILKIKESMQEEAKRFEKDGPPDHPEYSFMQ
ncbi:PREDICTED: single-stranded DNA-binding protein 3-like isoform X3 [Priapulus caudatus]|uniref:Single-stranded DNA-binding protein 3-like isoform X3 n=1 Tax=Priapulus caudatus TaxID=37621 RepID=A0ABM1DPN6_PRICU|nr:PREDICTED: single-stranded DNA-binding protein 3-like isoform X3 [Priapulus caudatus]